MDAKPLAMVVGMWGANLPGYGAMAPGGRLLLGRCLLGAGAPARPGPGDFVTVALASGLAEHRYPVAPGASVADLCDEVGRRLGWPADGVVLTRDGVRVEGAAAARTVAGADLVATRWVVSAVEASTAIHEAADLGPWKCDATLIGDPPTTCRIKFWEDDTAVQPAPVWVEVWPGHFERRCVPRLVPESLDFEPRLPAILGSLLSLKILVVGCARLYRRDRAEPQTCWELPTALGRLVLLETLIVTCCRLEGGVPTELGCLAAIRNLSLNDNRLSGRIPTELGALAAMRTLNLRKNRLGGPIPPELAGCASLERLNVSTNRLTGMVPPGLELLPLIQTLELGGNPALRGRASYPAMETRPPHPVLGGSANLILRPALHIRCTWSCRWRRTAGSGWRGSSSTRRARRRRGPSTRGPPGTPSSR